MKPFYRQFNDIHKMCNEIHVSTKHCFTYLSVQWRGGLFAVLYSTDISHKIVVALLVSSGRYLFSIIIICVEIKEAVV